MLTKKIIRRYGNGGAHITFPVRYAEKECYILWDEDEPAFTKLLREALLISRITKIDSKKENQDLEKYKRDIAERLTKLEKIVYDIK